MGKLLGIKEFFWCVFRLRSGKWIKVIKQIAVMKSRDSLKNERVPVFFKKSFKLCIHSIKKYRCKIIFIKNT